VCTTNLNNFCDNEDGRERMTTSGPFTVLEKQLRKDAFVLIVLSSSSFSKDIIIFLPLADALCVDPLRKHFCSQIVECKYDGTKLRSM
jgi:hypothetical protein